jgi:hypothetical protein
MLLLKEQGYFMFHENRVSVDCQIQIGCKLFSEIESWSLLKQADLYRMTFLCVAFVLNYGDSIFCSAYC